jgi:hypothetical protein
MTPYRRLMVDLETGGTKPGCPVFAIGAVFFSSTEPEWKGPAFYGICARKQDGLVEQEDTMAWWAKQNEQARKLIADIEKPDCATLPETLKAFATWCHAHCEPDQLQVWGNGADFDNVILSAAYHYAGLQQPWGAYKGRCYRTLKSLRSDIKLMRTGMHHNALDDALSQAEHAVRIMKAMKSD